MAYQAQIVIKTEKNSDEVSNITNEIKIEHDCTHVKTEKKPSCLIEGIKAEADELQLLIKAEYENLVPKHEEIHVRDDFEPTPCRPTHRNEKQSEQKQTNCMSIGKSQANSFFSQFEAFLTSKPVAVKKPYSVPEPTPLKVFMNEKEWKCDLCGFKVDSVNKLNSHVLMHTGTSASLKVCYNCTECDYAATQLAHLEVHMVLHSGTKPYRCNECHFRTCSQQSLIWHRETHTGQKPFSCDKCGYKTRQHYTLMRHKRRHDEKTYKCDECCYRARLPSVTEKHKRKHTGERPFGCAKCNFRAAHKCNLIVHSKQHTVGRKPYVCKECNYKTVFKNNLKRHKLTHTSDD